MATIRRKMGHIRLRDETGPRGRIEKAILRKSTDGELPRDFLFAYVISKELPKASACGRCYERRASNCIGKVC